MSFLDTKHKKKSFTITTIMLLLLLCIMFFAGMSYLDPSEKNGISVNLGLMDEGSGNVQPLEKIKSAPQPTPAPPQPQETTTEQVEEVLTSDIEDTPVIPTEDKKPVKEVEPQKETPKEDPKPQEKVEEPKPDPKPSKETTNALNNIINGPTSNGTSTQSEGDGTKAGDKGQADGDPYAASYYGSPGQGNGGRGWGLNGRGRPTNGKVVQECNESGTVVVQIFVNREGKVTKAIPGVKGTTNNNPCLLAPAKETALTYQWPADSKAPAEQIGFIVVNFRLGE